MTRDEFQVIIDKKVKDLDSKDIITTGPNLMAAADGFEATIWYYPGTGTHKPYGMI